MTKSPPIKDLQHCEWCHKEVLNPCRPRAWRAKEKCHHWREHEYDLMTRSNSPPVMMTSATRKG
jgi:hypothetical protein